MRGSLTSKGAHRPPQVRALRRLLESIVGIVETMDPKIKMVAWVVGGYLFLRWAEASLENTTGFTIENYALGGGA